MIEAFIKKIDSDEKLFTLEIVPSTKTSPEYISDNIKNSKIDDYVDGFVVVDSPFAKLRSSSILTSIKLQSVIKKPFISTITARDRNSLAIQADLIGANSFDMRLFLALTGDAMKLGNQKQAKPVFEGNSGLVIEIIKKLNNDESVGGYKLKSDLKPIYPFSVINSYAKDDDRLRRRLFDKTNSGTKAIFTQPIFEIDRLKMMLDFLSDMPNKNKVHLVSGFFPIFTYKTAYFLYSKLPGAYIPLMWLDKMKDASLKGVDEEFKVGFELSYNMFYDMLKLNNKIHIMCLNNYTNVVKFFDNI